MAMWGNSPSASWRSQHSVVSYPHNGAVVHGETNSIDPMRHYYGSRRQAAFIPRSDPARNQRPGSPFLNQHPPAQIHGSHFRSHHFREQATLPPRPLRAAPGENPYGNQTPGTYAGHPHHHGTHQNRSRGPYPSHVHLRHQDVGHQQANFHSNAQHPSWHGVPVWPIPSTTGDHGLVPQQMAWPTPAAAPAQPQGPYINEAATMLINSYSVVVPEATAHGLSLGAQPGGTPTLYMEASPNASQPMIGPCPDPTCNSANQNWSRKQELERHVLRHLPHHIYCPHCSWTGSRRYTFMEHYQRKHPNEKTPDFGAPEEFTIYDAKVLAKRLVNKEITMATARDEANALMRKKQGRLDK